MRLQQYINTSCITMTNMIVSLIMPNTMLKTLHIATQFNKGTKYLKKLSVQFQYHSDVYTTYITIITFSFKKFACPCICVQVLVCCMYVFVCMYVCVCMYVFVYVHMCIYINAKSKGMPWVLYSINLSFIALPQDLSLNLKIGQ